MSLNSAAAAAGPSLTVPKLIAALVCGCLFVSVILSMSKWIEYRGVYDDMCYLRQAHLFQRFGIDGLNTDLARDDDQYYFNIKRSNNVPGWQDVKTAPCHTLMPASGKQVIQYPPGTGFALAAFSEGGQAKKLYMAMTSLIFLMSLLAIFIARTRNAVLVCGLFGCAAIYFMVNPMKSSYSAGPTAVLCALAGFMTAQMAVARERGTRVAAIAAIGLLLGLAVNFRLPNILLSSAYFGFFALMFLRRPSRATLFDGLAFGIPFLIGIAPTLAAQHINAGSPFATTYSSIDVVPVEFKLETLIAYAVDTQGVLLTLTMVWIAVVLIKSTSPTARLVAWLTAANLAINTVFFLSHPITTPYYMIPMLWLSLWSLLFSSPDLAVSISRLTSVSPQQIPNGQVSQS